MSMWASRDACDLCRNIQQLLTAWLLHRRIVHQPVPPIPPGASVLAPRCITSSPVSPAGCVTGPGYIDCAYQNQIPPALPMLSCGEAIDRSLSFAKRVLSTLWPDLSVRVAEGKTEASKNRLATRTNRQTRSRAVIVVICLMVQLFIGYACRAHPISRQQLCRFVRKRRNDLDIRVFAGFLGC
jgi:hypothetical protein